MARNFFIGVAWSTLAIASGLAAMISYSEAGRLSGGSKMLAGAGAVLLASIALFTLVKGRIAMRMTRRIAMQGTTSRWAAENGHQEDPPGELLPTTDSQGPIVQLDDAQAALEQMRPVCRTSDALSSSSVRASSGHAFAEGRQKLGVVACGHQQSLGHGL